MLRESYHLYLANRPQSPNLDLAVSTKDSGRVVTRVPLADATILEEAIRACVQATQPMRRLASYERQAVLQHCVKRFTERREELAEALAIEAGKPIRDARVEATRLIDTFRIGAEEAVRQVGEVLPLDIGPRSRGYRGQWQRVPIGPCSFITPFNFPLNLAAHKIAPAIAVGNPFVLKPASLTPIGALLIGEVLAETELPVGAFSILPCRREAADILVTDDRFKFLSFTGSAEVGWDLKARAGKKKVALELGGNAACIVEPDADLDDCVERITVGAFFQSGQSCISVQRILIHESIYAKLRDKLVARAAQLKVGDPLEESTFLGPLITEREAERVEKWIRSAVARGGKLLCGGERRGSFLTAALLESVPVDEPLCTCEAFGPVAILSSYKTFGEALRMCNDSAFGLQVGLFTRDLYKAQRAWDELEVGGVIVGDVPSWRVDHMPYGGVKESGLGREGVRFAMEEMSEIRMLVVRERPAE